MIIWVKNSVVAASCVVLTLVWHGSFAGGANSQGGVVAASAALRTADAGTAGVASDSRDNPPPQGPSSASASPAGFRTKYAQFEPALFSDLPGWREDNLADAWKAFRGSCSALASRSAWSAMCQRSAEVRIRSDEIRAFFEREFVLYQIRNQDQSPAGIITGYYEPLLNGSRRRMGKFVYPVLGVPDDLLYLDSRNLAKAGAGVPSYARVEGRMVIPSSQSPGAGAVRDEVRVLDLGAAKPDIRDKKLRVRVHGDRIVPYYTRSEIEQGGMDAAPVLVWVDSVAALYSMQVQGSGKVRLPDGTIMRLAYAEQNGHPFLPPVRGSSRPGEASAPMPQTRGIPLRAWLAGDQAAGTGEAPTDLPAAPTTRGARNKAGDSGTHGKTAARDDDSQEMSAEVARVVDMLLKGAGPKAPAQVPPAPAAGSPRPKSAGDRNAAQGADAMKQSPVPAASPKPKSAADTSAGQTTDAMSGSSSAGLPGPTAYSSDPSYVFFRQVPDNVAGPIGALGVPLTAGRSIAVDPRTTPLGFPVFVASKEAGGGGGFSRLMIAQDTGGAIRGAVRADYFWGFGPGAGEQAGRMKQVGQMWLLLPKDQQLSAKILEANTRGGGGADCVVPDPELCVE